MPAQSRVPSKPVRAQVFQPEEESGTLYSRTRDLLTSTDITYLEIYEATGLPPHWLSFFANGKISNPSVNKVQKLYEHLTGTKLLV